MASPQTSTDLEAFLELETAVWDALVSGDSTADAASLHENFVGLYPTGYATKDEHVSQLENGPTVAEYALDETCLISVSNNAALFCYLATYSRTGDGAVTERMYVSSLWERNDEGAWLNTFSQDTPATGARLP